MARFQNARRALCSWRLFLLQLAAFYVQLVAPCQFPDLLDATLDQLRQGLDSGSFTSFDLTLAYMSRIYQVNRQLRAVNTINPDALVIAYDLDKARANGSGNLGPLHGIPVLLKDNIATNDRMDNTAGSLALVGARVPEDSTIAAKLRQAGAIILGKANMSEWAGWRSANSSGWSAIGGQCIGAYFPGQDPSGSSCGSAISAALGLTWASLGTETTGSIIDPAQVSNVVGIKPTVGLTSRYLVVPLSEHKDSVGPLARTVKDAAYLLTAIAGKDPRDSFTADIPFDDTPDYAAACSETALQGKRIGIPRELVNFSRYAGPVVRIYGETIETLRANGAIIVDNIELHGFVQAFKLSEPIVRAEFLTSLPRRYLNHLVVNPHNITSLRDLQTFTQSNPREGYPLRNTDHWQRSIDQGFDSDSPQFRSLMTAQKFYGDKHGLNGALERHSLNAVFVPSGLASSIAGFTGNPVVTVPIARMPDNTDVIPSEYGNMNDTAPNSPFGVAFTGARFSEEVLIGLAYALEQKTQVRKTIRPYIVPSIGLEEINIGQCNDVQ